MYLTKAKYFRLFSLLLGVVLTLLLTLGCSANYKDIKVVNAQITSSKMVGLTSMKVGADVTFKNPTGVSFKVQDIHGVLYNKERKLATFHSDDVLEIVRRSERPYPLSVTFILVNAMEALEILSDVDKIDLKDFTVDIEGNVKKAGVNIPVSKKDIPLDKLIDKSNISLR